MLHLFLMANGKLRSESFMDLLPDIFSFIIIENDGKRTTTTAINTAAETGEEK